MKNKFPEITKEEQEKLKNRNTSTFRKKFGSDGYYERLCIHQ